MDKNKTPMQLAIDISGRSSCSVRVGSVIVDRKGRLLSWGWNGIGPDGMGMCAECHALIRANRKRLQGSTVFIAGFRNRTGFAVTSKPCYNCEKMLTWAGIRAVHYLTKEGTWESLYV